LLLHVILIQQRDLLLES